ncbi:hypothetical protein PPACK8108_LOCUS513 [Phakopsora pachyrhizi]|uniref:Uncharacterized protein n=1 Tax=Phakopsora pachyrhizi TaxID=170000 RepID=A0AAV0AEW4_PHAPC|nr:hypothetical protein PPACK8108_LOCUS513 [Phakopsora pachyrhizi]
MEKKVSIFLDLNDPHLNRETTREVSLGGACPLESPVSEITGSNPQPVSTSLNDPLPNRETIREVRNCGAYPLKIPVNETEGFNSQPVSTCLNDPRHMTQAINPFANEPVLYSRQLN